MLVFLSMLAATTAALEPGLPSKTAVWAAAARAIGSKNPDPNLRNPDYLAIKFLGPREREILAADYPMEALDLGYEQAMRRLGDRLPVMSHAFRTKAFDAALLDALSKGVHQVVILGAGFDSRGYRFESQLRDVRFIEVDSGPTQEYKKQRVNEIFGTLPKNVSYVPVDFTKDNLLEQLGKAGYSEQQQAFFLWEGVTVYLPEAAVKDTLHFVRDHAAPGSRVAFDYILRKNPDVGNPNSKYARWGEPWIFGFPNDGAASYVRHEGLEVVSDSLTPQSNMCIARVAAKH